MHIIPIETNRPYLLSYAGQTPSGHSSEYHHHGYGSPVGKIISHPEGLAGIEHQEGKPLTLLYSSGVKVEGLLKETLLKDGNPILLTFHDCTVRDAQGRIHFAPDWGVYDMAVGDEIVSVFGGTADREEYEAALQVSELKTTTPLYTEKDLYYQSLFQTVREVREGHSGYERLPNLLQALEERHPEDWLCRLEILEILEETKKDRGLCLEIRYILNRKVTEDPCFKKLIKNGLAIIDARLSFK